MLRRTAQNSKRKNEDTCPHDLILESCLWRKKKGAILVLKSASDLQLSLCVIAHADQGGHRGQKSTERMLLESFFGQR